MTHEMTQDIEAFPLTLSEWCAVFRIDRATFYRLPPDHRPKTIKIGGKRVITETKDAYVKRMEAQQLQAAPPKQQIPHPQIREDRLMDLDKRIDEILTQHAYGGRCCPEEAMRQIAKEVAKDCAWIASTGKLNGLMTNDGHWVAELIHEKYGL